MTTQIKVALFSGGRGSAAIAKALASRPDVELTIIVNAYDDGLSTGLVRKHFNGMLGPSDIRKNFSHLLEIQGREGQRLSELLEYRINSNREELDSSRKEIIKNLQAFVDEKTQRISRRASEDLIRWINTAAEYLYSAEPGSLEVLLADMAIGNLALAGAYLESGSRFNLAIQMWKESFDINSANILNVTTGENLVLVGTKVDGSFLRDEAAIVDKQSELLIDRVYLLENYLTEDEELSFESLTIIQKAMFLEKKHCNPEANPAVLDVLKSCDLIVYGPGTQHSSLLPSYMTKGIADVIADRVGIEKVFIGNISVDYDIQSETVASLLAKVSEYMNIGGTVQRETSSFVSQCFLSTSSTSTKPWGMETVDASGLEVGTHIGQWSSDGSRHDGHRVSNGLVSLARNISTEVQNDTYATISVVIPVLNEIDRLPLVLEKLITFDWIEYSLVPEFIVVDGGSSDGSAEVVASFPVVKGIQLKSGTGRGEAIAAGIRATRGNFVVTFPSDDEYDVVAIAEVAGLLKTSHAPIVFGSRIGLCADTDKRLREIYGGRTRAYYMSKWGGFTLSIFSGVLYKRWISDTLTSIKGFTKVAVESLSLEGQSADWDMRVIIDASKSEIAIAEVPVGFRPRRVDQGKKIRPKDGVRAMIALFAGIRREK